MGLFDTIMFEQSPVTCNCGHRQIEFQTKNLDSAMLWYLVKSDGSLAMELVEYKEVPENEKDENGFPFFNGVSKGYQSVTLTRTVHCYNPCSECGDYWFDIFLTYEKGKLVGRGIDKVKMEK